MPKETQITAKQKIRNALTHLDTLRDEIREIQSKHPQSFIHSDKMFKLNNVRKNLALTSGLMNEIIEEM